MKVWQAQKWPSHGIDIQGNLGSTNIKYYLTVSVQSLCCVRLFATPWTAACQASLSITNSQSLLKLLSIELAMLSNHLILCYPLLLLLSAFTNIRVFSKKSVLCIRQPQYWSFSFSISPSNEHSGLISFRMDWLDLLAVQRTLKSLLQYHSSKTSFNEHPKTGESSAGIEYHKLEKIKSRTLSYRRKLVVSQKLNGSLFRLAT